jgi:iron complex outermembrane recepter protein
LQHRFKYRFMKNFIFCVLFFLVADAKANNENLYNLKGSFSGVVTDASTGKPLSGVSVYISDVRSGTFTNANGEFFIDNLNEGLHLVEFSHVGFNTIAEKIEINGSTIKNIKLYEAVVENNAVVVTGVSRATQLKKVPFQVSVMRKEELQQTTATNIIEAITKKSGVSSVSTGPAISKPVIRGLGYNRVLSLNDGIRQEGQQWGDEHGIEIDEASVQKIEILKGPASLVYGSDAMAGVINIISNVPVQKNTIRINVGSNYQTNNNLKSLYANIGGNVDGINWNLYSTLKSASDYKNKYDGNVFNSKFNEKNIGGYVGYNGNWGFSHLIVSNFNLNPGLIEGERDSLGNFIKPISGGNTATVTSNDFKGAIPQVPFQKINHFKIASDNSFKIKQNKLSVNLAYQQNKRKEFGNVDDIKETSLFFDLKTITLSTNFHLKESNGWKHNIGLNNMHQTNTNRGIEQLIPNYGFTDFGVFAFTEKEIKAITVSGGIRVDNRNMQVQNLLDDNGIVKSNGFKKTFSNFSGSAGLAYEITKQVNLKFNVAKAFRAPSIPELSSNGRHEGTLRYEIGNTNLKSETSTQFDASIELSNKHISFNVAGYVNAFSNFIFYKKLESQLSGDSLVDVGGDFIPAFKFDQQNAILRGVEINLDIHPHPIDWLHFQNTFSYVVGTLKNEIEGTKNLPFIPAPKLLTEIRADVKKLNNHFVNFYTKLEIENTFKQNKAFTAFNTETATSGYTLLNVGIGAELLSKKAVKLCSINIAANNIADVAYQNHLSRLKYAATNIVTGRNGVFNMGRNFSVRVIIPLEFKVKQK